MTTRRRGLCSANEKSMSIHFTKKGIHATGADANALFIAMAPDDQLAEWTISKTGSEDFQRMVREAISARAKHKEERQTQT